MDYIKVIEFINEDMNEPFEGKAFFYDNKKLTKYERLVYR